MKKCVNNLLVSLRLVVSQGVKADFKWNNAAFRCIMLVVMLNFVVIHVSGEVANGIGMFSVSSTKMVAFAPGNLQRNLTAETWMFASEQYEMLGVANVTGGAVTSDGGGYGKENKTGTGLARKIDLFGWSSTESNPKNSFGVSIGDVDSYYAGDFLEWGQNAIGNYARNTWHTLTYDEWEYMRYHRTNADNLIAIARIDFAGVPNANGDAYVNGLILLPDNWNDVKPSDLTIKPGFHAKNSSGVAHETHFVNINFINIAEWKKLEAAGAVFLPAGGMRSHTQANVSPKPVTGVFNTRYTGHYWTAKPRDDGNAGVFEFNSASAGLAPKKRYAGRSVRLVKDTLPLQVDATNLMVTSTAGQKISTSVRLTLSNYMGASTTITGYSDNAAFTVTTLSNVGPGEYDLIIHYTPTATSDGIETATITLNSSTRSGKTSFTVTGRHLPKNFVMAAKVDDEWMALTADISGNGLQKAVPIVVDDVLSPTKATYVPNSCQYQLLGLTSTRYTVNGDAVHLYSTQTQKVLGASNNTSTRTYLHTDASHANAQNAANALFYEWNLVSEDLVHYAITNSNTTLGWASYRTLGFNTATGMWGMYPEDASINQDILLLPIENVMTENIEVMEWDTNGMVLRLENASTGNINIRLGGATTRVPVTRLNGSDLYQVSDFSLFNYDCETMVIYDDLGNGIILRKPILVTGNALSTAWRYNDCPNCDIVVLNGAKLIANTPHIDFANIYVYPGGKLELNGYSLGVNQQVYLRGGYSWLHPTTYALPEVYINGIVNFRGSDNIIYDYYIQNYKYYQFALPYSVPLANVTDEAGYDNFPVWVKHYNGALRAADASATSWEWYYGDNFEAGVGYVIAAQPRQVGNVANRPLSIIRFPLGNEAITQAEANKSVATTAHGIDGYKAGSVTANNVGWNYVGNPFLATWQGSIGHQQLQEHFVNDRWDGSYAWVDDQLRYITVMSPEDDYDYDQYVAANAELRPFSPFFMQEVADGGVGSINFAAANRLMKAPAQMLADAPREQFVQIEIAANGVKDQTGLFVSESHSNDLDLDDYEKLFGSASDKAKLWLMHEKRRMAFEAMTEQRATTPIALGFRAPQAGRYILSLNEQVSTMEGVLAVYLTDHELGITDYDLMYAAYEFEAVSAKYNDTCFTIRLVLDDNTGGVATGVDVLDSKAEGIYKFIYQGNLYIYQDGIIYDVTGRQIKSNIFKL